MWYLNYRSGETVSVNELARSASVSWATAKKYAELLEAYNRVAPTVSVTSDGVEVVSPGHNLSLISSDRETQLLIYMLFSAELNGSSLSPISVSEHKKVIRHYSDIIDELGELGLIKCNDDKLQLTPQGISIAGPARSEIRNRESPRGRSSQKPRRLVSPPSDIVEQSDYEKESNDNYNPNSYNAGRIQPTAD